MTSQEDTQMTAEQFSARFIREHLESIAARLRRMADDVERSAREVGRVGTPGVPNYGTIAADVSRVLAWGFANLNSDQAVRHASDADIARASERAS